MILMSPSLIYLLLLQFEIRIKISKCEKDYWVKNSLSLKGLNYYINLNKLFTVIYRKELVVPEFDFWIKNRRNALP